MAGFTFQPLTLNAASALGDETKRVIAAFERCLATSDMGGLSALRSSIERRIDDLDVFYHENLVDERSLLFGKQRSKLRKLLNEYAAAVAAHSSSTVQQGSALSMGLEESRVSTSGGGGLHFGATTATAAAAAAALGSLAPSGGGGGGGGGSIIIRPDQRLTYEHLSWWFAQEGARELPGMDQAIVERVWGHTTRTNLDGKMSVSDLKGWYISFGKRALARTPPLTAADLERELVPTAFMYDSRASVNERVERAQAERERLEAVRLEKLKEITRTEMERGQQKAGGGGGGGSGSGSSGSGAGRPSTAPAGASASATASAAAAAAQRFLVAPTHAPHLALPSDSFDFQLRLTEEEYRSMRLRQRELLAMSKFKERVEAGQAAKARGGPAGGAGGGGSEADVELGVYSKSVGPYVDAGKRNAILYRS